MLRLAILAGFFLAFCAMGSLPRGLRCAAARMVAARSALRPLTPAEAGRARVGLQRAGRKAGRRVGVVEPAGRDVVRGIVMEDRGEELDLAAPGAELELAAAV